MPPIRNIQSGVFPGTPCGCTHSALTALQSAILDDNPTNAVCGTKDFSGANDPVIVGSPSTSAPKCYNNECLGVDLNDGLTGQYIDYGNAGEVTAGVPLSVELWFKISNVQPGSYTFPVIGKIGNSDHVPWAITWNGGSASSANFAVDTAAGAIGTTATSFHTGSCYQFVMTIPNNGLTPARFYVNGALDKIANTQTLNHYATQQNTFAGYAQYLYFVTTHYFSITVHIAAFYSSVLSAASIANHWAKRQ
jgi:hypothetical protein